MKRMLALLLALMALTLTGCAAGVLTHSNQGQAWVVRQGFLGFNSHLYHCAAAGGQARCTRVND